MWAVVFIGLYGHNGVQTFKTEKDAKEFIAKKQTEDSYFAYFLSKITDCSDWEDVAYMTD